MDRGKSDHKVKRAWERAKWAIVRDHKLKKVIKMRNMHHFEFVMELLKVLM